MNGLEPEKNLLGRRLLKSWASNGLAAELTKELGRVSHGPQTDWIHGPASWTGVAVASIAGPIHELAKKETKTLKLQALDLLASSCGRRWICSSCLGTSRRSEKWVGVCCYGRWEHADKWPKLLELAKVSWMLLSQTSKPARVF